MPLSREVVVRATTSATVLSQGLDVIEKDVEAMLEQHLPSSPAQCGQRLIDLDGIPWRLPCQKLIQPCVGFFQDVCSDPLQLDGHGVGSRKDVGSF